MDTLVESDSYADIVTSSIIADNPVLVKTARAKMDYNGTQVEVRIFIDEGSMLSYMRQDVALFVVDEPFVVDVLIGADNSWQFMNGETIDGNGPTVYKSNLGALLLGPVHKDRPIVAADIRPIMCFCGTQPGDVDLCGALSNTDLDNRLLTYFRCSEVGVNDVTDDVGGVDENFKAAYSEKIEFQDGKYSVPLPWKEDHGELPSNLRLCRRRLDQIVERLQKTGLMNAYCKVIKEHMDKCYVEEVKGNPWDEEHSHYMPHFFVLKNSETTPVRIVMLCH
ncbi:uncharacterized protein LOC135495250 [Lineus longissimus]|uniref:uncharacterized protein LOC135495250 n=1 Tax=Lineus longissimus TaxID=88925 RepID=UPI00315D7898